MESLVKKRNNKGIWIIGIILVISLIGYLGYNNINKINIKEINFNITIENLNNLLEKSPVIFMLSLVALIVGILIFLKGMGLLRFWEDKNKNYDEESNENEYEDEDYEEEGEDDETY